MFINIYGIINVILAETFILRKGPRLETDPVLYVQQIRY